MRLHEEYAVRKGLDIPIILYEKDYSGNFTIAPYEPEFIEIE